MSTSGEYLRHNIVCCGSNLNMIEHIRMNRDENPDTACKRFSASARSVDRLEREIFFAGGFGIQRHVSVVNLQHHRRKGSDTEPASI